MKVLQVIDSLNVGGAERVLVTVSNILHARGVAVSVCVLTDNLSLQPYLDDRIPVYRLSRTLKWSLSKMYELHRLCSAFDLIHIHLRYNLRYVGLIKTLFGGRYVLLLHDHYGDIEHDQSVPRGLAFFIRRAWYVGVHPALAQWAVDRVRLPRQRTFMLANTIVRSEQTVLPDLRSAKEAAQLRIIKVGNFRPSKNQLFAIELMARLIMHEQVHLDLVGQANDDHYVEAVSDLIVERGVHQDVAIRHDIADVQTILQDYQLAIHTASTESGPLVLLEYLSVGLPFVAYRTGQVARTLSEFFPEFFVDSFDVAMWIDRISYILTLDLLSIQQRMIRHFDAHYSTDAYGKACTSIYDRIIVSEQ